MLFGSSQYMILQAEILNQIVTNKTISVDTINEYKDVLNNDLLYKGKFDKIAYRLLSTIHMYLEVSDVTDADTQRLESYQNILNLVKANIYEINITYFYNYRKAFLLNVHFDQIPQAIEALEVCRDESDVIGDINLKIACRKKLLTLYLTLHKNYMDKIPEMSAELKTLINSDEIDSNFDYFNS